MLTTSSRLRILEIIQRLSNGDEVTLQERINLKKYADRDQTVYSWLNKALRLQQHNRSSNSIDQLMDDLDLGSSDPNSIYNPDQDDLGDWFSGAPSWIRRS
tara:strand:- start:167 stop:469 length:303 start_codon:yes stop_codon:yes gene_type:complete